MTPHSELLFCINPQNNHTNIYLYRGINNTPLHPHRHSATLKGYASHLIRFILMLLRIFPASSATPALVDINWTNLDKGDIDILNMLRLCLSFEELDVDQCVEALHYLCFTLWSNSYTTSFSDSKPDPLERYLILESLQADGSHLPPHRITNTLAAFKYLLRLCMLREFAFPHVIIRTKDDIQDFVQFAPWVHEKLANTTFSLLCSLQHRASALAYETQGDFRLYWPEPNNPSVLSYKGYTIHVKDIQEMFRAMEDDLINDFESKISLNLRFTHSGNQLTEDPSQSKVGYSFLEDNRNNLGCHRGDMLQAVMTSPALFTRFCYMQDSQVCWKKNALQAWLQDYAQFMLTLLTRCEMTSGGPARGTELTAMQYRSTPTRRQRNFMVFGQYHVLLRTYTKTSAITGQDRLIPAALDGPIGDLIIQELVFTRPFAEFAALQVYGNDTALLYYNHLFVHKDRLFITDDLSVNMKRYTNRYLCVELGVNAWRHIAIALRRKLCKWETSVMEDELEDTIGAEQAGHTAQTEKMKYGLSPDALLGQSEDVLPHFLEASVGWQKAMKIVPGNLIASFKYE